MKTILLFCLATTAAAQVPAIYPLPGARPAAIATDSQGNIYVAGQTTATESPVTIGTAPFLSKISPAGDVVWSTHFGGSESDSATAVAVDPNGNILVTGTTTSPDLPVVNAYQNTLGGQSDAYVLKFDPTGKILYYTYLGGSGNDGASGLAVDGTGAAYITGYTDSPNFPGQTSIACCVQGFVVKIAASGALVYSWESTEGDTTAAIAVDAAGNAYIAGSFAGKSLALKLSPDGSQVLYEARFGGSQSNNASAIALDSTGAAYIAGTTTSVDFPVVNPFQSTLGARPLWKSTDGGNSWAPIDNLPFAVLQQLVANPTAPQTLYAAASDTGVFQSTDGGNTWKAINNGIAKPPTAGALALNPANPSVMYAGINIYGLDGTGQIYSTVDGGATWSLAASLSANVTEIAVDPLKPSNVYAMSQFEIPVYSTDGGATWNPLPEPNAALASLLLDPVTEGTLWGYTNMIPVCCFGFASWIEHSTAGGATWQTLENLSPQAPGLFADPTTKPATIYAGVSARTNNGGITWTSLAAPPGFGQSEEVAGAVGLAGPSAMAIDPRTGTVYAAGYPNGGTPISFDVSTNQGQSWTQFSVPGQMPGITGIAPTQSALYASNNYIQASAFVVKLSPDGSAILYSTYLRGHGGTQPGTIPLSNQGAGIALDAAGDMVVVGSTQATDFPTVNAPQAANAGLADAFVAILSSNGQQLEFSTYLGGAGADLGEAVALDHQGDVIVAGTTTSNSILGVAIPPGLSTVGSDASGFVAKFTNPVPAITSVLNAASFQPGIESGSWVMIQGTNLANTTRTWQASDFNGNNLPTALNGVSVTIDSKPAFVEYISPTQINVQAPTDSTVGVVKVVVTNNGAISAPASAQLQMVAPAFFLYPGTNYAVASRLPDYAPVGNPAAPAKPGDTLVLWGTGFGATNPPVAAGMVVTGTPAAAVPTVTIGGIVVPVISTILTAGSVGLYQITIQVPAGAPAGDVAVQATVGSAPSPVGIAIRIAQ